MREEPEGSEESFWRREGKKGGAPSRTGTGGGPGGNNNAVPTQAGKPLGGGKGATVIRLDLEEDDAVLEG